MTDGCSEAIECIAQAGLAIAAIPPVAASLPVLVGVLYFVQGFYLRTSKQLRLLE
jgi:ATP-binding cassette, subfamily C (CFTR/MRP), member 1